MKSGRDAILSSISQTISGNKYSSKKKTQIKPKIKEMQQDSLIDIQIKSGI